MKTNRDYFSWSQYSTWKSSKLQFYKRYVLGEPSPKTPAFDKGKEFADYKETGIRPAWCIDPLLETVAEAVPSHDVYEMELKVNFAGYDLLAYLDSCNINLTEFAEYKTGKNAWDQVQVEKHEQLDFYAALIYILSGETIIPKCKLYWIETEEQEINGETVLMYTGHIEEFVREFTEEDIINMMSKVITVLKEIEEYEHNELLIDDTLVNRYISLLAKQKEINDELNTIKLEVQTMLESNQVTYATGANGRFSISERKSYIYSPELNQKKKDYNDEIKIAQKKEQDNGTAKVQVSKSLRFNTI